jgi:hypothetical protein
MLASRRLGRAPPLGLLVLGAIALIAAVGAGQARAQDTGVVLFWGEGCPHCAALMPVVEALTAEYGVGLRTFEIYGSEANRALFAAAGRSYGFEPRGVPTLLIGDEVFVGYGAELDAALRERIGACGERGCPDPMTRILSAAGGAGASPMRNERGDTLVGDAPAGIAPKAEPTTPHAEATTPQAEPTSLTLPLVGAVGLAGRSHVATTALIALVDGFNPCSLWVLSLLLAVVVNSGSRRRLVLVGVTFLAVAALVYALFIAGLVHVLALMGSLPWIRALVAVVALVFAAVNLKDYLGFGRGPSLTIPEGRKPRIYRGIRGVMGARGGTLAMVGATAGLAAGVTVLELPCTVGLPLVWADMVAGWGVGAAGVAGLLAVYLVVFLLDELALFGAAAVTLRVARLDERQGRFLKLVGGMLMLFLAATLVLRPAWMNELGPALLVVGAALVTALIVHGIGRAVGRGGEGPRRARGAGPASATRARASRTTGRDARAGNRRPRARRVR